MKMCNGMQKTFLISVLDQSQQSRITISFIWPTCHPCFQQQQQQN